MSLSIKNKKKAEILDVTLKVEFVLERHKEFKVLPMKIVDGDHEIKGDFIIHYSSSLTCYMILYSVKDFKLTYYKTYNGKHQSGHNFKRVRYEDNYQNFPIIHIDKKLPIGTPYVQCEIDISESYVGEILLQIELDGTAETKDDKKFRHFISSEVISQLEVEKNFTINCHGESFQFNKTLLSMMSDVFKKMVHGNSKESKSNCVEINDFHPKTIGAFNRVAFGDEPIQDEDLTTDLMMFANKYFMRPLLEKCRDNMVQILNNDNLGEIIKVAYHIDDEKLLKVCAKYLLENKKDLNSIEEWKNFVKANKDCMKQSGLYLILDD